MATNKKVPYTLARKVGIHNDAPVSGAMFFVHKELKGAVDVDFILINNIPESQDSGAYIFDPAIGKIDRSPNPFGDADTIVIPYNKLV